MQQIYKRTPMAKWDFIKVAKHFVKSLRTWFQIFLQNNIENTSSHQRYSIKKVFLKVSQNSQENICVRVSFFNNNLLNLLKNSLWHRCFFSEFCEIHRKAPFLQNTSGWLLLKNSFWIYYQKMRFSYRDFLSTQTGLF